MSSASRVAVACVLSILTATTVFAASRAPRQRPAPSASSAAPTAAQATAPTTRAALMARFQSIRDAERDAIRSLQARINATRDPVLLFALEMEVEHVKRDSEIEMLRAQVDYHRACGNTAVADQIESVIRQMTAPPLAGEPSARPVPDTESR